VRDKNIVLLLTILVCGCGGGRAMQPPPDHLLPAAKAMARGISYYHRGCYDRSIDFLYQAHERYAAADDRAGAAAALNNIGNVHRARKETERSLLYYDAAAELFTEIDHGQGRARALVNRASILLEEGRLSEAENAIAAARTSIGENGTPDAAWRLAHGILLFRKGAADAAEKEFALALNRAGDDQSNEVSGIHYAWARLLLETGRNQAAAEHAEAALAEDRRTGAVRKTADDLLLLGTVIEGLGRPEDTAAAFCRAMKIYAILGDEDAVLESAALLKDAGADGLHPLTLEFVEQWLKQGLRSDICR